MVASPNQRLSPSVYPAYQAALSSVYWYKKSLLRYLRGAFPDHPELLGGLGLDDMTKRDMAEAVVMRLQRNETKYRAAIIESMLDLAERTSFAELTKADDPALREREARAAVAELAQLTKRFREDDAAKAKRLEAQHARQERLAGSRAHADALAKLQGRHLQLMGEENPRKRGLTFEVLLRDMFELFDLEPRGSYSIPDEQIDGSFKLDGAGYLLEAKWTQKPAPRKELDAFAEKLNRKGRNTLGLFVSMSGFSPEAISAHSNRGTAFICMDGADVYAVLEGRIRLDELLQRKQRRTHETGVCFVPLHEVLS